MENTLKELLLTRQYIVSNGLDNDKTKSAYYNAFLLCNYGIVVDKPQLVDADILSQIDKLYQLEVPASFYKNPQDTKFFTKSELLIEQLVSYFLVETGTGIYNRVEIFEKDLPEYKVGDEITLRNVNIVSEDEAKEILREIGQNYCGYTRPFSLSETNYFISLLKEDLIDENADIKCKDNIINLLLNENVDTNKLVRMLDKKDIVKLSIKFVGERADDLSYALANLSEQEKSVLIAGLSFAKNCPLTKKQSKYFNKLVSYFNLDRVVSKTVPNSPYKSAIALLKDGKVVESAKVFAKSGSLLERNLKMLLSRANPSEAVEILNLIKVKNPIVLLQLVNNLNEEEGKKRTFVFTTNNRVKKHIETDYEAQWRKSRLSVGTVKYLRDVVVNKIYDYYGEMKDFNNVYINPSFYKIGLPTNTSAMGEGIDVIPTGSRLPINTDYIRTFVTWKGVYDIDASLSVINVKDKFSSIYFGNYSEKPFGNDVLFSGDCRAEQGTEFYDINIKEMKRRACKYVVLSLNGYSGSLNEGEIYCGYQNKNDINTKAWDPKNIALKFRVKGDSRVATAFAIDLTTDEIVIINQVQDGCSRVIEEKDWKSVERYLNVDYLDINIGKIIEARSINIVDNPEDADIVFDNNYKKPDTVEKEQKIVRSFDIEKLVSIVNGK